MAAYKAAMEDVAKAARRVALANPESSHEWDTFADEIERIAEEADV